MTGARSLYPDYATCEAPHKQPLSALSTRGGQHRDDAESACAGLTGPFSGLDADSSGQGCRHHFGRLRSALAMERMRYAKAGAA